MEETKIIFEEKFNYRSFFVKSVYICIIIIVVIFLLLLLPVFVIPLDNLSLILIVVGGIVIILSLPSIYIIREFCRYLKITFKTDGRHIYVVIGRSRIKSFSIPVRIVKSTGIEGAYLREGIKFVKRLYISNGQETLVIAEEYESSTMERFNGKPVNSDFIAENPGTLDRLEIALSKYLEKDINIG